MTHKLRQTGVHCCLQIILTIPEWAQLRELKTKLQCILIWKKKQGVHYGMDIRPEPEKCTGPLHMAGPHCRLTTVPKILGPVQNWWLCVAFPIYSERSEKNKSNRKGFLLIVHMIRHKTPLTWFETPFSILLHSTIVLALSTRMWSNFFLDCSNNCSSFCYYKL